MSTFKSWLVANIEVILIIFTVMFLIITSLIMIPKAINEENDALINGYAVILMTSILLCSLFVYAIRNGFMAFVALALFLGFVSVQAAKDTKEKVQKVNTEVVSQVQDGTSNSDSNDLDLFLYETGKKFRWIWLFWICIPAAVFGVFTAIYANVYFDDVVSRRFFYRNSNVEVFAVKWKYTFNRFYAGFVTLFTIGLEIMLFILCQP